VVRHLARSIRYRPEFPISTLALHKTLCLPPSGVKVGSPLCQSSIHAWTQAMQIFHTIIAKFQIGNPG
jgi:hypothetical protein